METLVAEVIKKKAATPEPEVVTNELEEEELDEDDAHETITYNGVDYYWKLDDNTVYDKSTQEFVGTWNDEEQSLEFETEEE